MWQKKLAVLALYFNLRVAVLLSAIGSMCLMGFSALGVLPVLETYIEGQSTPRVIYCLTIGNTIFLLALFFGGEVNARLGCDSRVFLDKVCINQVDAEAKSKGIAGLAAFISKCDKFLVVYSDEYLQKLWTVYELATCLTLHPRNRVVVIPLFVPLEYITSHFAVGAIIFRLLQSIVRFRLSLRGIWELALVGLGTLPLCTVGAALWYALLVLRRRALESQVAFGLFMGYIGLLFLVTFLLYRPVRTAHHDAGQPEHEDGEVPASMASGHQTPASGGPSPKTCQAGPSRIPCTWLSRSLRRISSLRAWHGPGSMRQRTQPPWAELAESGRRAANPQLLSWKSAG